MLGRLLERRSVKLDAWARDDADLFGAAGPTGVRVTESNALQLMAVTSSTKFLADAVSQLPVDVYRRRPDGSLEEVAKPPFLRDKPNSQWELPAVWHQSMVSLLLRGNGYWIPVRSVRAGEVGQVTELWPMHPDLVDIERTGTIGKPLYRIAGQVYTGELIHIPGLLTPNALKGLDPINYAAQSIGLGLATQIHGSTFFGQGAVPSGVISTPGDLKQGQAKELKENWLHHQAGLRNSNLPAVLTGGAEYTPITISNEQSQFLETREFGAEEIRQLFMPSRMIRAGATMTYSNTEQTGIDFIRFDLQPWLVRLEAGLTRLLPRGQFAKFNVDAFLRADLKTRYEAYGIGIDKKFLVPNDAREKEDLEPLDGGDVVVEPPAPVSPASSGSTE